MTACLLLILGATMASLRGDPPQIRVAVISDEASRNLAALVTAELSSNHEIHVLERDDLAKAGDERKLQQLAGNDTISLGKLVGADGLLFLDNEPNGPHLRFTAVSLGYALFDDRTVSATDPAQLAKSLAHRVNGYASKLKLDPAKAIPLSILNLRADYGSTQSLALERNLTLLLESRLAAVPNYVVLERRHAWSLGFEHSLIPEASPLLRGAYLIDGSFSLSPPPSDHVQVTLRLRIPNGGESTLTTEGSAEKLNGLADQIVADLRKVIGGSVPAMDASGQEAKEYLREALWGWRSRAPAAGLEAADSAELLSGNEADLLPLRAHCLGAMGEEGMEEYFPYWKDYGEEPHFNAVELSRRTDLMLRALNDATRYRNENLESKRDLLKSAGMWEQHRFTAWGVDTEVAFVASKILYLLDEAKSSRADELRQALRGVTGYDPLHGKKGKDLPPNRSSGLVRELFANTWASSLEEIQAYYRLVLTDNEITPPTAIIFEPQDNFGTRFLPTPEARQQAFDALVESLKAQPQSQRAYFMVKTHAKDPAVADAAYRSFLDELWPLRDELVHTKGFTPLVESFYGIEPDVAVRNTAYGLPLLHYLFTSEKPENFTHLLVNLLWHPNEFPPEEIPQLWQEFLGYRKKVDELSRTRSGHSDSSFAHEMDQAAAPLIKKYPDLCVSPSNPVVPPAKETLAVTKFWHPWTLPGAPDKGFTIQTYGLAADGLWLGGRFTNGMLYHINLTNFTSQSVSTPDQKPPMELQEVGNHVYMTYFPESDSQHRYLARYDVGRASWESRRMPDLEWLKPYEANGALYFFVTVKGAHDETALVRYDWENAKWIELTNNRRRPAQNQFDDAAPMIQIGGIFTGPNHRPCVTLEGGTFYLSEEPGEWAQVFDDSHFSDVLTIGDRSLVVGNGELTMLEGAATEARHWVANTTPHVRQPRRPGKKADLVPTPWSDKARWKVSPPDGKWNFPTTFHGDNLYLLSYSRENDCCELLCYVPGEAEPRHVPLAFHLDDPTRTTLTSKTVQVLSWAPEQFEHPEQSISDRNSSIFYQFVGTPQGICFLYPTTGFWFLPFADIEAYLQSHPATSATPPAASSKAAPSNQR